MRRKSMLPGAILTLLTLVCLLIPGKVTLAARERMVGWFSPILRLVTGSPVQAAHAGGAPGSAGSIPLEVQARVAVLETRLKTDQRILNELRGRPADADPAETDNNAADAHAGVFGDRSLGPLGRFLARPIWNGRALYTVDVGSDLGVQIGDGVVAQGGGAGVVVAISPSTATFSPLSFPGVAVQAMVARSRAMGLLTGTGRGLELRYLQLPAVAPPTSLEAKPGVKQLLPTGATGAPAMSGAGAPVATGGANAQAWASYHPEDGGSDTAGDLQPGDLIVATGRDGLFPEGTPLGWVEAIAMESKAAGGLRRITVKPWGDPNAADAVRVCPRRPEPIPLPEDPRELRKRWEALQAAQTAQTPAAAGSTAPANGAKKP